MYAEWKQCRVGVDYHVEVDKHFYSVPHTVPSAHRAILIGIDRNG
jgi:hypothetical protein